MVSSVAGGDVSVGDVGVGSLCSDEEDILG